MSDPAVAALGDQQLDEVDLTAKDPLDGEVSKELVDNAGETPTSTDATDTADVSDPAHRGEEKDTGPVVSLRQPLLTAASHNLADSAFPFARTATPFDASRRRATPTRLSDDLVDHLPPIPIISTRRTIASAEHKTGSQYIPTCRPRRPPLRPPARTG